MLVLACAGVLGFSLLKPDPVPPARWLDFTPTAAQERKMQELRAKLHAGERYFPREAQRERENAQLFTYMAGTSDEELVVIASLDAMGTAYGARSTRKAAPDRDVERVLVKHLSSKNPARMQAAFEAARHPIMAAHGSDEFVDEVSRLAREGDSPALRLAALETLLRLPQDRRGPRILRALLDRTSDEAPLAVTALLAMQVQRQALSEVPPLLEEARQKVSALTSASDPGVRGTALEVWFDLGPDGLAPVARQRLADPDPYVRGVAAGVLAKVGGASDIHLLMPLASDHGEARTVVRGVRRLDGQEALISRKARGYQFVAECALSSAHWLAQSAMLQVYGPAAGEMLRGDIPSMTFNPTTGIAAVEESARRMRLWYEGQRAFLPREPRQEERAP